MGNSPSQNRSINVNGKTVVHTTSAGTQGIANAIHADEILGGSFVNARATAEYILNSGAYEVSLVCRAWKRLLQRKRILYARYIKGLLENKPIDLPSEIEKLKYTSGAKFFDPAQREVFPQEDFSMCTDVDRFYLVLKLAKPESGIPYMTRQSV